MANKILITLLLSVIAATGLLAQSELTEKHQLVSGTRVWMIPPEGAVPGIGFNGFQIGEEGAINVMEVNPGNYFSSTENVSKENFETKGIKMMDLEELELNGYPAKYFCLQSVEDETSKTHNLVFGDSTFSVMLIGVNPGVDENMDAAMKTALLSTQYQKEMEIDYMANAPFTLDDSETTLKFAQANANMFIFTPDGVTENIQNTTMLLAIPLPSDGLTTPSATCELMLNGLKEKGITDIEIISSEEHKINDYVGYEIIAKSTMEGKMLNIYIQVVAEDKVQVVLQGISGGEEFDVEVFRELTQTLYFK